MRSSLLDSTLADGNAAADHGGPHVVENKAKIFIFLVNWLHAGTEKMQSVPRTGYSTRNASSGEIELARSAGINDAAKPDNPSVKTAASVTAGLYGLMPLS